MASFDGITWGERGDGGEFFPIDGAKLIGTIYRPPGGSVKILHTRYATERTLTTAGRVTLGQFSSLKAKARAGVEGSLTTQDASYTAVLQSVDSPAEVSTSNLIFANLTFRITAASGVTADTSTGAYGSGAFGTSPYGG